MMQLYKKDSFAQVLRGPCGGGAADNLTIGIANIQSDQSTPSQRCPLISTADVVEVEVEVQELPVVVSVTSPGPRPVPTTFEHHPRAQTSRSLTPTNSLTPSLPPCLKPALRKENSGQRSPRTGRTSFKPESNLYIISPTTEASSSPQSPVTFETGVPLGGNERDPNMDPRDDPSQQGESSQQLVEIAYREQKENTRRKVKRIVAIVGFTMTVICVVMVALSLLLGRKIDEMVLHGSSSGSRGTTAADRNPFHNVNFTHEQFDSVG